jgi:SDR family mycofactocin-dependent oxidoreductase
MGSLEGKVAFVTGAARGQGRSHAVRLAHEGADIIAVDICDDGNIESIEYKMPSKDDLAETANLVKKAGRRIIARQGDVRNRTDLEQIVGEGIESFGAVDIVVANAGMTSFYTEKGKQDQAWHDSIAVMLTGVYLTIEVCIPQMVRQGRGGSIVITSSTAGLKGIFRNREVAVPGALGYGAAKHGVVGLMRMYAGALASDNIRVNTIHPTGVNTPMVVNEGFEKWAGEHQDAVASMQNALPVELLQPSDISNAVAWLCSDEARYITGITLPVDAGFLVL